MKRIPRVPRERCRVFFFFNDTATTEIYTLSLPRRSSDLIIPEQEGPRRSSRESDFHPQPGRPIWHPPRAEVLHTSRRRSPAGGRAASATGHPALQSSTRIPRRPVGVGCSKHRAPLHSEPNVAPSRISFRVLPPAETASHTLRSQCFPRNRLSGRNVKIGREAP